MGTGKDHHMTHQEAINRWMQGDRSGEVRDALEYHGRAVKAEFIARVRADWRTRNPKARS